MRMKTDNRTGNCTENLYKKTTEGTRDKATRTKPARAKAILLSAAAMILALAGAGTAKAVISKPQFAEYKGHYYQVYNRNGMDWEEAVAFCKEKGGYLASITSAAEDRFAYKLIQKNGYSSVLFGLTDRTQEGAWRWQNGEAFSYSNWADGEPNGGSSENYGMYYYKFADGKWNDGGFDVDGILCEWDKEPDIAKEFTYKGHRYQLFHGAASWKAAKKYCESKGGYLFIPNNAAENSQVYQYMRSAGETSAYMGIWDPKKNGNWITVNNYTPGYTNWASGEPNDSEEPYAMFYWKFTDGTWNDGAFSEHTDRGGYSFLCEWGTDPLKKAADSSSKNLSKATITLSATSLKYNGKPQKPKVTVKLNGKKLSSSCYTVSYTNNTKIGTAKVKVTGRNGYTGSKTKTFQIKAGASVKVSFYADRGTLSKKSITVKYGTKYGTLPTARREGYEFQGWYTKKKNGKAITKTSYVISPKAHTLYAVWKKVEVKAKSKVYACIIAGCNSQLNGYTRAGATDFANKLKANRLEGYSIKPDNIKLHIVKDSAPTRDELNEYILRDLISAGEDDLSFVYYCGHGRGSADQKPGLGICLKDNNYNSYYSYDRFLDYLGQNVKGRIVLVVDACFSGGFVKAAQSNDKVSNRICVLASSLDTQPTDSYLKIGMDLEWSHVLKGFAVFTQACYDAITKGNHQYHCFTYAIMRGLNWSKKKDYPADTNKDHVVTCYELKAYVENHMPKATTEIPRFYVGRLANQPIFGY